MAHCPFHDDRRPSLSINPDKRQGLWYCHVCDMGGDVLTFVEAMEDVGFLEACRILAGGRLPERSGRVRRRRSQPAPPVQDDRELTRNERDALDTAVRLYHTTLLSGHKSADTPYGYLIQRGLTAETIREFQIGYCSGDLLVPALKYLRCSLTPSQDVGLLRHSDDEQRRWELFSRRVVFGERNRSGEVIHMAGRALPGRSRAPKYLFLPGVRKPAYGLSRVDGSSPVFIVESIFDYVTLVQWGFQAVAALGTSIKPEDTRDFDRCPVAFLPDNDRGGAFSLKHWREAVGHGIVVPLPSDVADVNDLTKYPDPRERFLEAVAADVLFVAASAGDDPTQSVEDSLADLVTLWRWGHHAVTITDDSVHERDILWLRRALRVVFVVGDQTSADRVARWQAIADETVVLRLEGVAGVRELAEVPIGKARFKQKLRELGLV
jgi:DNA primase